MEDLGAWSRVTDRLYIWDYVVNFTHYVQPHPNFAVLGPNIRTLVEHNALGIMEQGQYQCRGGEFAELRAYVLAKLLWDPNLETDEIVDDFMSGYYGRSGAYVGRYFDLLQSRVRAGTRLPCHGFPASAPMFDRDFTREADRLFDAAEAVAETEEIRRRVELARLPLRYVKIRRNLRAAETEGELDRFRAVADREGVRLTGEFLETKEEVAGWELELEHGE
jgi:hypothetical protein